MKQLLSALAVLVVVVGLAAVVHGVVTRGPRVIQPIAFNHTIHLKQAKMECLQCHLNAQTSVSAGIPGKDVCLDCHDIDEEEGTHPQKDLLFEFDETDDDIPWQRVAVTRPDIFFSHRRHVTAAKLDCLQCHKDQETLVSPPPRARLVMSMSDCVNCHAEHGLARDCVHCHR
ncbi:MAG: cytochrome c3 family protein [Phycisphaerae bacterium]